MSKGSITIHGNVGMHLGAYMAGGRIEEHDHATDWIGAEMKNGFIHVHGNIGGQVGAAYHGSLLGMKDGTIIIDGFAGLEVGMPMKGLDHPRRTAKDFAGLQIKGGTIVVLDGAEIRTGAWMNCGTIVSMKPLQMMPTFERASDKDTTFLSDYASKVKEFGINLIHAVDEGN